jgi:hypothetical protein
MLMWEESDSVNSCAPRLCIKEYLHLHSKPTNAHW